MSTYYATKTYIVNLTLGIIKELEKDSSKVKVSLFCPGPVKTNFNNVANVKFYIPSLSSEYAAKCAIDNMFKNKKIIIPNNMKINYALIKIMPFNIITAINSNIQKKKN